MPTRRSKPIRAEGSAGSIVPLKRIVGCWRVPVACAYSVTPTATETGTAAEATPPETTRYSVFSARPSTLKAKLPLDSVSSGLPTLANGAV